MGDVVLVVEKDDRVRLGIRQAFKAHQFPLYEVSDPFDAMSALGRASFGAIVVSAGKRQLSLRGLCQLARKRHPGVALFIITSPGVTAAQLEQALGVNNVTVVAAGTTTVDLARMVAGVVAQPFAMPTTTPEGPREDSDEATRPHHRYPSPAPQEPPPPRMAHGPARTPPLADAPAPPPAIAQSPSGGVPRPVVAQSSSGAVPVSRAPSGGLQRPPTSGATPTAKPTGTVRPLGGATSRDRAPPDDPTTLPVARGVHSQAHQKPVDLPPDEPLGSDAFDAHETARIPVIQGQPTSTGSPVPELEAINSAEGRTEPQREAAFTAVVPLSPDEPTATNFENPLAGVPSSESAGRPLPSAATSPALSDAFSDEDATMPMPAWRPPDGRLPNAHGEASPTREGAGFSDPEPTMPAAPFRPGSTSDSDSNLPEVSAMVSGEQLPQPIDLPPVPPPSSGDAEPTVERTVPETKLMGALIDTNSSTAEGALLEGSLEERPGAPVLMTLLAQEITGVLHVHDGEARGRLFCLHGEPVYAEHADGDGGLLVHLQSQGIVPGTFRAVYDDGRPIPDGQLLAVLSNRGLLTGEAVHEFLRSFVRARVLALVNQSSGTYAFFEETSFVDTKPLLKVNPFGLILDAQRRSIPPDDLMRRSSELEWLYVQPRPALAPVAEKLRPFVRGTNLAEHISGQKRVKQLLGLLGLDDLMGTLLMLTLERAGLVKIAEEPMESFDGVELADSTIVQEGRMLLPDSEMEGPISADETKAREEIFSLYVRLKPLVMPRDVLGVPLDADVGLIKAAYYDKMTALDPKRIPEGSARSLMVSRVEELRRKITSAYEALTLDASSQ